MILRLSLADVKTLCLSFNNCSAAIFFPCVSWSTLGSGAVTLDEEYVSTYFSPLLKGGFQWFFVYSTAVIMQFSIYQISG